MGSISRESRCTRFIEEFAQDIRAQFHINDTSARSQGPVFDDVSETVRYGISYGAEGESTSFISATVIYDPEMPWEEAVEHVTDVLLLAKAVESRMRRVDLK